MLSLQIHHNGNTLTYPIGSVERDDYAIQESSTQEAVSMADVQVRLHADAFLGAPDVFSLPAGDGVTAGSWRARLLYAGAEVMQGVVRREGGVSHRPKTKTWTLTLVDDALASFLKRAEAVEVDAAPFLAAVATRDVLRRDSGLYAYREVMYEVPSVWARVAAVVGGVAVTQPAFFPYTIPYVDGGVARKLTRSSTVVMSGLKGVATFDAATQTYRIAPSMPPWNGRTLVEAVAAYHAWKMEGRYAPYPSRDLLIRAVSDAFTDTYAGLPALDGLLEKDGDPEWAVSPPEFPDLAATFQGEVYERQKAGTRVAFPSGSAYVGEGDPCSAPEVVHRYAYREAHELDEEGDPANDTVIAVPFHLPYASATRFNETAYARPDAAGHPNLWERVRHAEVFTAPAKHREDAAYLVPLSHVPLLGGPMMVYEREFYVAPDAGAVFDAEEVGPRQVAHHLYDVGARPSARATVRVHNDPSLGSIRVGDPAAGVTYQGRRLIVAARTLNPRDESLTLELQRPL